MAVVTSKVKFITVIIRQALSKEWKVDVKSYLSGYADGEGCFCVSFSKSKRHKLGREIRPSFSVSQNRDRMQILKMFREHFGCGHIRQDRSDNTFKYEVRSLKDLVSIVIPHFRNYPLLSETQRFPDFCGSLRVDDEGETL